MVSDGPCKDGGNVKVKVYLEAEPVYAVEYVGISPANAAQRYCQEYESPSESVVVVYVEPLDADAETQLCWSRDKVLGTTRLSVSRARFEVRSTISWQAVFTPAVRKSSAKKPARKGKRS